jgi:hypothetical protein
MAPPYKGAWLRRQQLPQSSAAVWGTGINPVHSQYGGPAVRMYPIRQRHGEITPAAESVPEVLYGPELWGYQPEDSSPFLVGITYDDRPAWDVESPDNPSRYSTDGMPPLNASGAVKALFRSVKGGAFRYRQKLADSLPSETVSEGWLNKATGKVAEAKPSDPSQYEIQTSMAQRFLTQDNRRALMRETDDPREPIESRVQPMIVKQYSEGERHYDMFPKRQDDMPRPFYYRTAGTGPQDYMKENEMWSIDPVRRVPPEDPSLGVSEVDTQETYGYTGEDYLYA